MKRKQKNVKNTILSVILVNMNAHIIKRVIEMADKTEQGDVSTIAILMMCIATILNVVVLILIL